MKIPRYFRQENDATCSLAVLRMALDHFGIQVSEHELLLKVRPDYGKDFTNIWNPTIAKIACQLGLETRFFALWPLLKKEAFQTALEDFSHHPQALDTTSYERRGDTDKLPEPLDLAYRELFLATQLGCQTRYGTLTARRIQTLLKQGYLLQTTIKLQLLYPGKKRGLHSVLIYATAGDTVSYHDPFHGEKLSCSVQHLLKATSDVGAFIAFRASSQT